MTPTENPLQKWIDLADYAKRVGDTYLLARATKMMQAIYHIRK